MRPVYLPRHPAVAYLFLVRSMTRVSVYLRCATVIAVGVAVSSALAAPAHQLSNAEKKFKKSVADNIGRIWYASLEAHKNQLVVGTTRVRIVISPEGKILDLQVVSNTSNELSARLSTDAIRRADIPRVPSELLTHGACRDEYTFRIYPN